MADEGGDGLRVANPQAKCITFLQRDREGEKTKNEYSTLNTEHSIIKLWCSLCSRFFNGQGERWDLLQF